mmetsp:Transcript_27/g.119  ORF Transcript_27/g.119 Transcript_27/m.119 type:complete len:284 (-) Transcript_27:116-967(-)
MRRVASKAASGDARNAASRRTPLQGRNFCCASSVGVGRNTEPTTRVPGQAPRSQTSSSASSAASQPNCSQTLPTRSEATLRKRRAHSASRAPAPAPPRYGLNATPTFGRGAPLGSRASSAPRRSRMLALSNGAAARDPETTRTSTPSSAASSAMRALNAANVASPVLVSRGTRRFLTLRWAQTSARGHSSRMVATQAASVSRLSLWTTLKRSKPASERKRTRCRSSESLLKKSSMRGRVGVAMAAAPQPAAPSHTDRRTLDDADLRIFDDDDDRGAPAPVEGP